MGRDTKKRQSSRPRSSGKTKETNMRKSSIIKARQRKSSGSTRHSNPAFSITINKDTDCSVMLLSAQPNDDVPFKLPTDENNIKNDNNLNIPDSKK